MTQLTSHKTAPNTTPDPARRTTRQSSQLQKPILWLPAFLFCFLVSGFWFPARAACSNPSGNSGGIFYNADYHVPQYCNGSEWIAFGPPNSGATSGGCTGPAGSGGDITYNADFSQLQYCDGGTWRAVSGSHRNACAGPPDCPSPGNVCTDGTVFAGCPLDLSVPIFVTRCDAGQTWGGSSCTGTALQLPWNNANASGYTATGVTNRTDGQTNTAALVTIDSDSGTAGIQPHQAAQYCKTLSSNGHSDWYLPAPTELLIIYTHHLEIGNFTNSGLQYWASADNPTDATLAAHVFTIGGGLATNATKERLFFVRCARKD